jgi:hypothetical protein
MSKQGGERVKLAVEWFALALVVAVLFVADMKHLGTSYYNWFLILLFALITGLILLLKRLHRPEGENRRPSA